ncbi:MAG: DegT/DnrJ/EryC1/StrS family aminotransferase [Gammaproteobacteria bacterium]|nr:DegT/DnrJ/EryC1/StrS family aminotransferase [Gammaproteobacteria bacterium]
MKRLRLWPCKDIDLSWLDVCYAFGMCFLSAIVGRERAEFRLLSDDTVLTCMSVRAAFDLYLTARNWDQGDECIFVGLNVPDMFRIAESHGLCVCGTDIDPITTQADLFQLRSRINPRTRFIVIPHLFGHRLDLRNVIELAERQGIDVIEDCAQAFSGKYWWGTRGATVSLFSFGPMKTATALQGAVAIVRDSVLANAMKCELATYATQPTWRYLARVLRFAAIKIATYPVIYGLLVYGIRKIQVNHEDLIHSSTKSLSNDGFKTWLRARPCGALVRVLERRVEESDASVRLRELKGTVLHEAIANEVPLVLRNRRPNSYWMIPVLADDSEKFKNALRNKGFDALSGRLATIGSKKLNGSERLEKSVMLPFSPRMLDAELHRLGVVVTAYAAKQLESECGESDRKNPRR